METRATAQNGRAAHDAFPRPCSFALALRSLGNTRRQDLRARKWSSERATKRKARLGTRAPSSEDQGLFTPSGLKPMRLAPPNECMRLSVQQPPCGLPALACRIPCQLGSCVLSPVSLPCWQPGQSATLSQTRAGPLSQAANDQRTRHSQLLYNVRALLLRDGQFFGTTYNVFLYGPCGCSDVRLCMDGLWVPGPVGQATLFFLCCTMYDVALQRVWVMFVTVGDTWTAFVAGNKRLKGAVVRSAFVVENTCLRNRTFLSSKIAWPEQVYNH